MKDLLIQAARRSGIADADELSKYFDENADDARRADELLLAAPSFTEDTVLKLFAEALGVEYFGEVSASEVPAEFVEAVPATYAQHHYLIGIRKDSEHELTVVLSKPLDTSALDNVSRMVCENGPCIAGGHNRSH